MTVLCGGRDLREEQALINWLHLMIIEFDGEGKKKGTEKG